MFGVSVDAVCCYPSDVWCEDASASVAAWGGQGEGELCSRLLVCCPVSALVCGLSLPCVLSCSAVGGAVGTWAQCPAGEAGLECHGLYRRTPVGVTCSTWAS